jgi:outer membrane protein OmpA-like peptidoglycan-associated protein
VAVNFRVNSAILSPEAKASLDNGGEDLEREGYMIEVSGYTDATGSEAKTSA